MDFNKLAGERADMAGKRANGGKVQRAVQALVLDGRCEGCAACTPHLSWPACLTNTSRKCELELSRGWGARVRALHAESPMQ